MSEEFIKAIRDGLFVNTTQDELSADRIYEVAENIAPDVLNAAKKELMEDGVYTAVFNDWTYGRDPDHAVIPAIHLRTSNFTVGDIVRVLIVKEKQI